ncbi:MAG: ABC transporter ATP-binding protein [Nakamurella sp.]
MTAAPLGVETGSAVELHGLTKRFGDHTAVDGISITLPKGSFVGVVGRNGAGKTTTMKMCTALLPPTAGTVSVMGIDVWANPVAAKEQFGVLPETMALFDRLTGAEMLLYNGLIRGLDRTLVVERSRQLLHVLGLDDAANRLVVDYSHGMTKKVALAAALLHGPQVLFLDEPFEAIDPVSTRSIEAVLHRHVQDGGTVVFSSHVLDVVERLCDRVVVIDLGQIKKVGTVDEVRHGVRLEDAFLELIGEQAQDTEGLSWLGSS